MNVSKWKMENEAANRGAKLVMSNFAKTFFKGLQCSLA
jgi:hypothetical protein